MASNVAKATAVALLAASSCATEEGQYQGVACSSALQSLASQLNDVCCSPLSNCVSGIPVTCSAACADLYVPFSSACGSFIQQSGGGLADLAQNCDQTQQGGDAYENDICPTGYLQHGDNCYLFSLDIASYDVAEKACETLGGELACIDDQDENAWISAQLGANDDFWIGLHDRSNEGQFEWSGGNCASSYTNWFCTQFPCQEPNNAAAGADGADGSDCVRMCPAGGSTGYIGSCAAGSWADYACTAENHCNPSGPCSLRCLNTVDARRRLRNSWLSNWLESAWILMLSFLCRR